MRVRTYIIALTAAKTNQRTLFDVRYGGKKEILTIKQTRNICQEVRETVEAYIKKNVTYSQMTKYTNNDKYETLIKKN